MACDICLFFDDETEDYITQIWRVLRTRGISSPLLRTGGARPHLTLAIIEDFVQSDEFIEEFKGFASRFSKFPIVFSSIASFGQTSGAVFLGPAIVPELVTLHTALHNLFEKYMDRSECLYGPGSWVPHCSLAFQLKPEVVQTALDISLNHVSLPLKGMVEEIGIITFDNKSVHSFRNFKLQ